MRNYIQSKLKQENEELEIGCYDKIIDTFSKRSVNRIIENAIDLEHTDIAVTSKNKKYIVEISTVDNEKDFKVKTPNEYKNLYGREI
jgi:hypothetical protein